MERHGTWTIIAALALTVVLAGCGTATTSPSSSPTASATTSAPAPPASAAPSAGPSASSAPVTLPSVAPSATPAPASAGLVLGGTWLSPKASAKLTNYTTTLAAIPTASGTGVTTFTKVVFSAISAGAKKKVVCTATEPSSGGASCEANLLALGVPPGAVSFSFDVYGVGVEAARSPAGARSVIYAVPPPTPVKTIWTLVQVTGSADRGTLVEEYRATWSAPAGYATKFKL